MNHNLDTLPYLIKKYFKEITSQFEIDQKSNNIYIERKLGAYRILFRDMLINGTSYMDGDELRKCIELIRVIHYDN